MLHLLLGKDWISNRDHILGMISADVSNKRENRILIVPELISHDMERRLCVTAGDTASRYCEVLSFSRLAQRVADFTGHNCADYLDNGGRMVAMAAAVRQMHGKLKAYASLETKPEFLAGLVDAVDEFKCCCIKPEELMFASRNTQGVLSQKLEEIAYIYETYDAICSRGKKDPRDLIMWMLDELEDSDFAEKRTIYIDGFPDFTQQNMRVISHFIQYSPDVYISLNCDKPNSSKIAFEKAGKTAQEIIQCAREIGIDVDIQIIEPTQTILSPVKELIFEGNINNACSYTNVNLFHTESVHLECMKVAEQIIALVQKGVRYRDIGVVCADVASYKDILQMVFNRCGIPAYLSGTDELLEKNVITAILSAFNTALGDFDRRDVLQYLKSILSPLSVEQSDMIENYSFVWNICGLSWLKEWTNHPDGLTNKWTDENVKRLKLINEAKNLALNPLENLRAAFLTSTTVSKQVEAVYNFFVEIKLDEQLATLAAKADDNGDNRTAQILNQLWEILIGSLEQMHSVLGELAWDTDTFAQLFKLLLSQYDVGTIPPVLDSVSVGPIASMRCQQTKHLFVVGACEGVMPKYGTSNSVLSDVERKTLRGIGIPVNDGSIVGLQAEFAEIYGVFSGATESITVSYTNGQPSFICKRIGQMTEDIAVSSVSYGAALTDKVEAAALLARHNSKEAAENLSLSSAYSDVVKKRDHTIGTISKDGVHGIYGDILHLSASQVDCQAQCRFSYFLNYGLKVKEWKTAEIDPSEFGTYVHDVLENTVRFVMEKGGFTAVSAEEISVIARDFSQKYAREHFSQIDSERLQYIFNKNIAELDMIVQELWQEMQLCEFIPVEFELGFGVKNEKLPPIQIASNTLPAVLRGYVDRVDMLESKDGNYFRVVDYKTGVKNFDYCDIYNGIGLQLLLYMFALEQGGGSVLGDNRKSAGVMYFPARAPYVSLDCSPTDEQIEKQRNGGMKRRGLLLFDEDILRAMEALDKPKRLPITRTKDGKVSGDIATVAQLDLLKKYVFKILGELVDEIASGNVSPNPYMRGSNYGICSYCPYGQICHRIDVEEIRNYKTVPAQKFWEDIESEVNRNG